jgi:hypothetical protein
VDNINIARKKGSRIALDSANTEQGPVVGPCDYRKELLSSMKGKEFFLTSWVTISFSRTVHHGVNEVHY